MATSSNSTTIKAGGTPTALTNEATTEVTANTVFQITDAAKRVLDPDTALVVEVDDGGGYAAADAADYTVDYMFGKVTFAAALGASDTVRVSGKYVPLLTAAGGVDFEIDDSGNLLDDTEFGDTWRSRFLGLQEASGSFTLLNPLQLDLDGGAGTTKLRTHQRAGTKVLLEYRPGGSVDYWRAWVFLSNGSEKAPVDGRFEGTVQFSTHAPNGTGEDERAIPTWGSG